MNTFPPRLAPHHRPCLTALVPPLPARSPRSSSARCSRPAIAGTSPLRASPPTSSSRPPIGSTSCCSRAAARQWEDDARGDEIGSIHAGVIGTARCSRSTRSSGGGDALCLEVAAARLPRLDGDLGKALERLADSKNLVIISWWQNGFRHITNNRGPIKTPADLKGLKIRRRPTRSGSTPSPPSARARRRWPSVNSTSACSRVSSTRRRTRCPSSTRRRSSRCRSTSPSPGTSGCRLADRLEAGL